MGAGVILIGIFAIYILTIIISDIKSERRAKEAHKIADEKRKILNKYIETNFYNNNKYKDIFINDSIKSSLKDAIEEGLSRPYSEISLNGYDFLICDIKEGYLNNDIDDDLIKDLFNDVILSKKNLRILVRQEDIDYLNNRFKDLFNEKYISRNNEY